MKKKHPFGSSLEAFFYPFFLLCILWLIYWGDQIFPFQFYKLGVLPRTIEGLKGILFMPLIHSETEISHLVNNSGPIFILLATLIYFYKDIALKVFIYTWILTGLFVWIYAENKGSYHIGISGIIYGLAAFLFTSGFIRKFLPLQAISLFVAFFYGSMIWGVLPIEEKISWEGHLMGFMIGIILANVYKKEGPEQPKFQYEIEKEMGIEPPDLEGMWRENIRILKEKEEYERLEREHSTHNYKVHYHYKTNDGEEND
jgi:membrane associated rhomboid family serine protease